LERAKKDPFAAAAALTAFFHSEDGDSEEAVAGALLLADGLHCLRLVRDFLTAKK
jgi:hypothetical protein